jgi:hypothetical protein
MNYSASPYSYSGVSDWGSGGNFLNTALAFTYVIDKVDWNRYRDNNSPLARLIARQAAITAPSTQVNGTLYLPTDHNGTSWEFRPLSSAKSAVLTPLVDPNSYAQEPDVNKRVNTHFFLNSMGAFEHALSYILLSEERFLQQLQ